MRTQCQRPDCAEPASVAYRFDAARQMVILDQLHGSLDAEGGSLCARHAATMVLPRGWWLDDRRQAVPTLFAALKMQLADQPTDVRRRRVVAPRRSPEAPRGAVVRRRRGQPSASDAPVIVDVPPIAPAPKPVSVVPVPVPVIPVPVIPVPVVPVPVNAPADGPLTIEALVERFMAEHPVDAVPVADTAPVVEAAAPADVVESVEAAPPAEVVEPAEPHDPAKPLWTPDFDAEDDLGGLLNAKSPLLSRAFSGRSTPRPRRTPAAPPATPAAAAE